MDLKITPDAAALPMEHEPRAPQARTHRKHRTAAGRVDCLITKGRNHPPKRSPSSPRIGDDKPLVDASLGKQRSEKRPDDPAFSFEQQVEALAEAMIAASGGDQVSLAARFRILTEAIAHVSAEKSQHKPKASSMSPEQTALLYEMLKAAVAADQARAEGDWPTAIQHCNRSIERLRQLAQRMA